MMSPDTAALLGALTVLLGLAPAIAIALAPARGGATTALRLLAGVGLTVLVMRVGAWSFASVHLKNAAGGAFLVGSLVGAARARRATEGKRGMPLPWGLASIVLGGLVAWAIAGSFYRGAPLELRVLPVGPGDYAVLRGGSSPLTNPGRDKLEEAAAVDIVRLAPSGNRATRFVPRALEDYASFGAPVLSPCEGEVVAIESNDPDVAPGVLDDRPGNYVILRCSAGLVKLAHLQNGSVKVKPGARVKLTQELARIGNSGATAEPHLHVGAFPPDTPLARLLTASGDMPLTFDGHVLVANTTFTVDPPRRPGSAP